MREFNTIEPNGGFYRAYLKTRATGGLASNLEAKPQRLVEFSGYCLIKNHYHFLLRQLVDGGIGKFMHRLSTSYTMYFNRKYKRSGSLFQGAYKAIPVKNYSHFLKLLVYVNCNAEVHRIAKAENWPWSSYLDHIGKRNGGLCNNDVIFNEFRNREEFRHFCQGVIPNIVEVKKLKKYLLE